MGWIDVNDDLPKTERTVICMNNEKWPNTTPACDQIFGAVYLERLGKFTSDPLGDCEHIYIEEVTHWMPSSIERESTDAL